MSNKITNLLLFLILLVLGVNTYFSFKSEDNSLKIRQADTESVPAIKSMPDLPKTALRFDSLIHNFGVIKDDKKQYHAFEFTNTGKEPLIILGAEGSCGCTVPSWPRDPIAPGKSAKIEVSFDPNGKSGEQSKIVTVTSNTEPTTSILTITATIIKSN
ncbi:MAG: DUF1573 domain-containing protein [Chitinophagales bacterium]|jgi:hypothetical protein